MTCVTIRRPVRMKMIVSWNESATVKVGANFEKVGQEKCLFRNDGCVKWCSFSGSGAMMLTMMLMMMVMMVMMVIVVGAVKSNVV